MQMKELVCTRQARTQTGCMLRLDYYRLKNEDTLGCQYGAAIRCTAPDGISCQEIPAITTRPERIQELLTLLANGTVTPVTLQDIVEDFI